MNKLLPALVIFLALSMSKPLSADTSASQNVQDSPPVTRLKELLDTDDKFRENLMLALDQVAPLPQGQPNPWQGKSKQDLYDFLNEWFYFMPDKNNGLDRIVEFSLLYYKSRYGQDFINQEPGRSWALDFVAQRGKYLDSQASLAGVEKWLKDSSVNNEEFVVPEGGYKSFNDYFVRRLKPGRRPVAGLDEDAVVVSPADCIINLINNDITAESDIKLKGNMTLNISRLLGGSKLAEKFIGGRAYACFLMPENYHHYHSPVAGMVVEARDNVGNKLFGLEDLIDMVNQGNPGYNRDFSVFEDFKHGYLIIETEKMGKVAMVPVGLQTVGSVVFRDKFKAINADQPVEINKGEAVGHFAYGGSTVLLIFEKGKFNAVSVKQGQQIGIAGH
ncbi:MAG: phosphatidylserine decarboxylase [Proteobacteria bacterium]|nr:phosphatidylserine decarboxylase [Pseudomonadota bacterium]